VSTTEELLGRKSSGSGPENRKYGLLLFLSFCFLLLLSFFFTLLLLILLPPLLSLLLL
jgi:hypothetical protein